MITKDINGTNLSANYDTAVATSPRQWQVQLYVNGTLLSCGIKKLEITKGSCGSTESFSIGNVYASMMTAELLELNTDIKGKDVEVRVGLLTSANTWEWITVGWFTAIEVVKTVYSTNVTAYGFTTSKTAGSITVPATLSLLNIANAITTAIYNVTGETHTVTFDTGINTGYVLAGTLDSDISCYQALQILAHAVGGYAVDTNDGNFAIHKFSNTSTLSVATDRMKSLPNFEELAFTVTGVQVTATGQYTYSLTTDVAIDPDKTYYTRSGTAPDYVYTPVEEPDVADIGTYYEQFDIVYTYGSPIVLYDENENMSANVFDIYKGIVGYSYYTGTIDLSVGDARIEGNDVLTVTDVDSNTYTVPCHIVTHHYDGGLSTTIQAVKSTSDGDGLVSVAPITQQIDQMSTAVSIAKASAQNAQQYASEALNYANQAKQTTDEINAYATLAGKTVTQILNDGETAGSMAQQAIASASTASEYASRALGNLSTVQSVAETLTWIAQHGTMTLTTDVALDPTHVYFVIDANGDYVVGGTHYAVVSEPDVADIGTYYVLSIDESLNNYVGTHLAVDGEGLWLIPETNGNKVLIATGSGSTYTTAGTYIIDSTGGVNAKFLADRAQIGNDSEAHLLIKQDRQVFYHSNGTRQAVGISEGQVVVGMHSAKRYEIWQELSQYGLSSCYNAYVDTADELAYMGVYADEKSKLWSLNTTGTSTTTIATPLTGSTIYFYWAGASGEAWKLGGVFIAGTSGTVEIPKATITYDGNTTFTANKPLSGTLSTQIRYITTTPGGVLDIGHGNTGTGKTVGRIGVNLLTDSDYQTAIGKYNISDSSNAYALIVGNGTSNARSNGFTVDWQGRVECGDYSGSFKSIFDIFYPVGSYYETSDTTFDPNVSWGGTWVEDTAGRVLVAQDTSDTAFDTIGEVGGSKYIQAHNHGFTQPTAPSHNHTISGSSSSYFITMSQSPDNAISRRTIKQGTGSNLTNNYYGANALGRDANTDNAGGTACSGGAVGAVSGATTGSAGNLQPYVVVKRWHRTA